MSSDVISCLHLDKGLFNKLIIIKELNGCDSSFIISCVLNYCIKNRNAVLIVSTHNSLYHYQNVGLKMNYNLQTNIESGYVEFYNMGEEAVNNLLMEDNPKADLLIRIKEKILSMQQKHKEVNVIVDGISHLFDFQYTLREINSFCKVIIDLVKKNSNTFILFQCNTILDDELTSIISSLLSHKAHTLVEVENLPSGLSTDVSGHLTIKYLGKNYEKEHMFSIEPKSTRFLFKLFDRGVKLFSRGEV